MRLVGSAEKPLIMALAPSANTETLMAGGESIAAKLTELTGYTITATVPTNYAAQFEAIRATGANWVQVVRYGVIPQIVPPFTAFIIYHWDINMRISTIIGFIGAVASVIT